MNEVSPKCQASLPVLAKLGGKRRIGKADVAALRASDLALGLRCEADAEAIFAIERGATTCRDWSEFLVETMLDFLVWDQSPIGTLSEERALWLLDQAGDRPTPAILALLVAILDEAEVPAWFEPAVRRRAGTAFGRGIDGERYLAA